MALMRHKNLSSRRFRFLFHQKNESQFSTKNQDNLTKSLLRVG